MKVSEIFKLNKTQPELDFVDISPNKDIPLFLDPHFLSNKTDNWSSEATKTVQDFFKILLNYLSTNKINEAKELFSYLGEPNETCLGLSKGSPQGRGVGKQNTEDVFQSILQSKAITTKLIKDLQDFVVFVDGFGKDKLSDMTTNIIKKQLITYTQAQCRFWGIPLRPNTNSGWYWNRLASKWETSLEQMLVIGSRKILLVPKAAVSYSDQYTPNHYYNHFVLDFLQNENLRLNTTLVQKRNSGDSFVTKKSIIESGVIGEKEFLRKFSLNNQEIFKDFKRKTIVPSKSLDHGDFGFYEMKKLCGYLINELITCPSGPDYADKYHRLMVGILEVVFYPNLICPTVEQKIHEGRKRIDITFDNSATEGMFLTCPRSLYHFLSHTISPVC